MLKKTRIGLDGVTVYDDDRRVYSLKDGTEITVEL